MWYFYKASCGSIEPHSCAFAIHFFLSRAHLVGGLEVLVGVAGVVAVLVGCWSLSAGCLNLSNLAWTQGCMQRKRQMTSERLESWAELTVGQSSGERVDAVEDDGACRGRRVSIFGYFSRWRMRV
jgi:hypothetical protein